MRSLGSTLSLALLATLAQFISARSLYDQCVGLRLFEQKLQSAEKLAWLGDECAGYEFEPSTTGELLIGELKQLLDSGDSQLHRSVKQFKQYLEILPDYRTDLVIQYRAAMAATKADFFEGNPQSPAVKRQLSFGSPLSISPPVRPNTPAGGASVDMKFDISKASATHAAGAVASAITARRPVRPFHPKPLCPRLRQEHAIVSTSVVASRQGPRMARFRRNGPIWTADSLLFYMRTFTPPGPGVQNKSKAKHKATCKDCSLSSRSDQVFEEWPSPRSRYSSGGSRTNSGDGEKRRRARKRGKHQVIRRISIKRMRFDFSFD